MMIRASIGLLLLVVLAPSAAWADERCTVGGMELVLSDPRTGGLDELCERMLSYLSIPEPPYTSTVARQLEARLEKTTYFRDVECVLADEAQRLECGIEPQAVVRNIRVSGSFIFDLLEADLRRRMTIRPGSMLGPFETEMPKQSKRISEFLTRRGFFHSKVRTRPVTVLGSTPNLEVDVEVHVTAGWTSEIRNIEITGDPVRDEAWFRSGLSHRTLGIFAQRFQPDRFNDDLDELTDELRAAGWPAVRLTGRYTLDEEAEAVDVQLKIRSGPKLSVVWRGNREFDRDDLDEMSTFHTSGALDAVEVEETAKVVREAYQAEGYHSVAVSAESEFREDALHVVYQIDEGPQGEIEEIQFIGLTPAEVSALATGKEIYFDEDGDLLADQWIERHAQSDARRLKSALMRIGYPDAAVKVGFERIDAEALRIRFEVERGAKKEVRGLEIEGLPDSVDRALLEKQLALKPGAPFIEEELARDYQALTTSLVRLGFTEAKVSQTVENGAVHYAIVPGRQATYGGRFIRGAFHTSDSLIDGKLDLEPGEPLDVVRLGRAKRELRKLGVFRSVELVPLQSGKAGETWVLVGVEESDLLTLDIAGSVSTDDLFSVGFDLRDRNLLGRALRIDFSTRWANASQFITDAQIGNRDRVRLTLGVPEPFQAPFDIESRFTYEMENRDEFKERVTSGGVALVKQLLSTEGCGSACPDLTASFGYEIASTYYEDKDGMSGERDPFVLDNASIGRLVPELRFSDLDSFLDPKRGYRGSVRFELALPAFFPVADASKFWRLMATLSGAYPLFTPFSVRMTETTHFGGTVVLAALADFGVARTIDADGFIPTSETFFYGGDQSVRGLNRRASADGKLGALNVFVSSLELRWYLFPDLPIGGIQIAGFVDQGTVSFDFDDLFVDNTVSVGGAVRWVTPVGPISFAYGKAVIVDPDLQGTDAVPENGRFHLTFGYSF